MMPTISGETAGTETNPLENPVLYEMKKNMPGLLAGHVFDPGSFRLHRSHDYYIPKTKHREALPTSLRPRRQDSPGRALLTAEKAMTGSSIFYSRTTGTYIWQVAGA